MDSCHFRNNLNHWSNHDVHSRPLSSTHSKHALHLDHWFSTASYLFTLYLNYQERNPNITHSWMKVEPIRHHAIPPECERNLRPRIEHLGPVSSTEAYRLQCWLCEGVVYMHMLKHTLHSKFESTIKGYKDKYTRMPHMSYEPCCPVDGCFCGIRIRDPRL